MKGPRTYPLNDQVAGITDATSGLTVAFSVILAEAGA